MAKLHGMKMLVQMKDVGDAFEVDAINPDLLRYEIEGHRYGLPKDASEAALTFQTFVAWAAMMRLGMYAGEWQKFKLEDCLVIEQVTDEDGVPDEVPPTQDSHESDSY